VKFLHQIPFLRLAVFFIAGIILQAQADCPPTFYIGMFVVAALLCICAFLPAFKQNYDYRFLFGVGLALGMTASAAYLTQQAYAQADWNLEPTPNSYHGQIIEEPVHRPKTYLCKLQLQNKKVILYLPIDSCSASLVAGDHLKFTATLEATAEGYQRNHAVAAIGFVRAGHWQKDSLASQRFSLPLKALSVRRVLLVCLRTIVPDTQACAIASALMFGYRNDLDNNLVASFRNIGAAHILAISGTHFAIVFGMLYALLSFWGNSRRGRLVRQLMLLPLVWGFAFLTGFSPSVVRAATMLSIWGIGDMSGHRGFTLNTVAISAFFMLLFNPLYLFDVGFQLSYVAVLSILLIYPHLSVWYRSKNLIIRYLWDLSCVSIAAQIGVLPLSVYYFNQFPRYFLLTNLCLLPLTSALLFFIPLSLLLHAVFGNIAWLMFPLRFLLRLFLYITQSINQLPFTTIDNLFPDVRDVILMFISIALIILFMVKKRAVYLVFLAIVILLGFL